MPQNVKKSSIWSPFLARGLNDVALRWTKFFQGLLPVPFLCEKCPLRYLFFAWTSWSILVPRLRAFCARIWNWLKLYSQPLQFSKKCHENENAVFNTAKWLRILMHPIDAFKFWIYWCTRSKNVWMHLGPCWFFGPKNSFRDWLPCLGLCLTN